MAVPSSPPRRIPITVSTNAQIPQALRVAFAGIEVAHRAAKQIGFRKVKCCYLIRNPKYLFLIEDDAERFIEQRSKCRVNMLYRLLTLEPADEGIFEPTAQWTGAVECKSCHDVIFGACVDFTQPGAHAFNLGNGRGFSVREVIAAAEAVSGRAIAYSVEPRRAGDPAVLVAASDRAREVLGWRPAYDRLEPIIETALRWHRAQAF